MRIFPLTTNEKFVTGPDSHPDLAADLDQDRGDKAGLKSGVGGSAVTSDSEAAAFNDIPLCVDLDGTLVKSDTFYDSICGMLRTHPTALLRLPGWVMSGGKAHAKAETARLAPLDVTQLPYNRPLLQFLEGQHKLGRPIYLATGADHSLARRVADHLGIFAGVLASDGTTNLIGSHKLAGLKARFSEFDYVGNAPPDLPALANSRQPSIANPTLGLRLALKRRKLVVTHHFVDQTPLIKTLTKAIRMHQWAKNTLLFMPLLLSHEISWATFWPALIAFFCFSFVASANYIVNDLLDIENDRQHPKKRFRPFAAGNLTPLQGAVIVLVLLSITGVLLPRLPLAFTFWLIFYIAATSAYSFYFKRVPLVDVLLLSGLYTLRMLAGGAATETAISPWLSSLAIFLFLSLAMVKRFSELANLRERGLATSKGRGYQVSDLEQIRSFGTASAYAAVVVFSLYISRPDVDALYRHSGRLWIIVPFMLYWLNRVWLLASRGELDEDPVIFAMRDRVSLALAAVVGILAVFATL